MRVYYRSNLNISTPTGEIGLWFLERENRFPQSHPISEGIKLQLKSVTAEHGGYYYCCIFGNNIYDCALSRAEVQVFSKLLSKCNAMHS